jgi:crossover junction endodeoxyribonuclease RuvC
MRFLGIDVGQNGAAAVIEVVDGIDGAGAKLVDVIDIPTVGSGTKTRVDAIGLRNWITSSNPDLAGVELAGSMPRQGVASSFRFGRAAGVIESVVACCGVPMVLVTAAKWKRAFNLSPDKELSRQLALQRFPTAHDRLARKMDHQRAEALLLALYVANNRGAP